MLERWLGKAGIAHQLLSTAVLGRSHGFSVPLCARVFILRLGRTFFRGCLC